MNSEKKTDLAVVVGSRIHLSLTNTTTSVSRVFGGAGIYTNAFNLTIRASRSKVWDVAKEIRRVTTPEWLHQIFPEPVSLSVYPPPEHHVGLGVTSQMLLALAHLSSEMNSVATKDSELAGIAKRGGASAVGTALFERGGFVVDLGRGQSDHETKLKLSDFSEVSYARRPRLHFSFPDWTIVLGLPRTQRRIHGPLEQRLFEAIGSMSVADCDRVAWNILFEVVAGVQNEDFSLFCDGVEHLREIGFKAREIEIWGDVVTNAIEQFRTWGLRGVTMSSWGPLVVGFSERSVEDVGTTIAEEHSGFEFLKCCRARNEPAVLVRL